MLALGFLVLVVIPSVAIVFGLAELGYRLARRDSVSPGTYVSARMSELEGGE